MTTERLYGAGQWSDKIRDYVETHAAEAEQLLKDLSAIPAPSGKEGRRADFIRNWLEARGSKGVYLDAVGNLILPYKAENRSDLAVYMAHMDVVFPDEDKLQIRQNGRTLTGPGVGDDTANLVNLLMAAAFFLEYEPAVDTGILFVADVCEEGLGNLRGCRQLMEDFRGRIRQVVSFDLYMGQCFHQCVGSLRYEIYVHAQGGHSFACFGNTNAVHQLSQVVCRLYEQKVPKEAPTTYNVGTFEGGTSVNTIAESAKILYEIRSVDAKCMEIMRRSFMEIIRMFREQGMDITWKLVGERPCAGHPDPSHMEHLIGEVCRCIKKATGEDAVLASMSTDANIPLSIDIPAVTLGTIVGGGAHTREEWVDLDSLKQGMFLALAVVGSSCRTYEKLTETEKLTEVETLSEEEK